VGAVDASVVVFAPSLVLTVTIEQRSPREPELHIHAGGQGLWVARMAVSLGARVTLCTALGGESGGVLAGLLAAESCELLCAACAGANGAYVHDRRGGERMEIAEIPGAPLSRHELDDLYGKTLTAAMRSGTLVLAGSRDRQIAGEVYRRLATDARQNGIFVVADLTGEALEGALAGGVGLLKISEDSLPDQRLDDAALPGALAELHRRGAENVIVSRAEAGALALIDGRVLEVVGPRLTPADHHGAGDSMTAAASVGIARGLPASGWLRLATSAGAVNATRHGLGTGAREEIEQLVDRVQIHERPAIAG
jgi:1-phosphofructokinase